MKISLDKDERMSGRAVTAIFLAAIFAIGGSLWLAVAEFERGRQVGLAEAGDYRLSHDAALRDMGLCEWADAVARRVQCVGKRPE